MTLCVYALPYLLHVEILYVDTMCYDDIHEVTLAFPPWRGVTEWYQSLGYREVGG